MAILNFPSNPSVGQIYDHPEAGQYKWNGYAWERTAGGVVEGPVGPQGETGPAGPAGADGAAGPKGDTGDTGPAGAEGLSAYEVAVTNGYPGTEAEWVASLEGPAGPAGADGAQGAQGIQGEVGPAGPAGADGAKGDTGPAGPAGPAGADSTVPGPQGEVGPAGPAPDLTVYYTKAEVDALIATALAAYLPLTGGTLSGALHVTAAISSTADITAFKS